MKKMILGIWLLCIAGVSTLGAYEYDYNGCCSDEGPAFTLYADYLYWKVCQTDIQIFRDNKTNYLNSCYDSGWRVGGTYACENWDVGVRYTSFEPSNKRHVPGSGSVEGVLALDFDWRVVDIELGYALSFGCDRYTFRPFVGAKLAWIEEKIIEQGNNPPVSEVLSDASKQDVDGYGLYLGAEGRYQFCTDFMCCNEISIGLVVRGSYGILDSTSKTHLVTVISPDAADVPVIISETNRKEECLFLSTIEVFAGLDIGYECGCFSPHLMVGYEANKVMGWREPDSSSDIAALGLGGLVLRFQVGF